MKRVWRTVVLFGVAASAGYAVVFAGDDGATLQRWAHRLQLAAAGGDVAATGKPWANPVPSVATAVSQTSRDDQPIVLTPAAPVRTAQVTEDDLPKPFSGKRETATPPTGGKDAPARFDARPVPNPRGPADSRPKAEDGRRRLASAIQTELARVGCYAGNPDGDWDATTQRAMRDFNGRINAALPVEQPDYILLTLLQGHLGRACTTTCPDGQTRAETGACSPRRVVAAQPQPIPATPDRNAVAVVSPPTPPSPPLVPTPQPSAEVVLGPPRTLVPRATGPESQKADPPRTQASTPKIITDQQRADLDREQVRLAVAVERRKKELADRKAMREEADRLARLADAEQSRATEESKRLAALTAAATQRSTSEPKRMPAWTETSGEQASTRAVDRIPVTAGTGNSASPAAISRLSASPSATDEARQPAIAREALTPVKSSKPRREPRQRVAAGPRITPPPYFVGRLPPRYAYWGPTFTTPPAAPRRVARRGSTQAIFPYLSRYSP